MSFYPTTANYHFKKPVETTEIDAWGDDLNDNWDSVDSNIKIAADAAAAAAAAVGAKAPLVHRHTFADIDGTATSAQHADGSITNAKLDVMPVGTIKGVALGSSSLAPSNLTAAQVTAILGISGTATIPDGSVTNAKLTNMAANTIKGAVAAGAPIDLTGAQVLTIAGAAAAVHNHTMANITDLSDGLTKEVQNPQSGNYTLVLADAGKMVTFSAAAVITINTGIFSAGHRIDILQLGTGAVTFAGTATRRLFPSTATKLAGQYAGATIWFTNVAGECVIIGNLIA